MLVLSRKVGDKITIGNNITVVVNRVDGNRVSLAIQAPANVRIMRGELAKALAEFQPPVADEEDHHKVAEKSETWAGSTSPFGCDAMQPFPLVPR